MSLGRERPKGRSQRWFRYGVSGLCSQPVTNLLLWNEANVGFVKIGLSLTHFSEDAPASLRRGFASKARCAASLPTQFKLYG